MQIHVNHNTTDKKILDKIEYYFITGEALDCFGAKMQVTSSEYDITTKDDVYTLEIVTQNN